MPKQSSASNHRTTTKSHIAILGPLSACQSNRSFHVVKPLVGAEYCLQNLYAAVVLLSHDIVSPSPHKWRRTPPPHTTSSLMQLTQDRLLLGQNAYLENASPQDFDFRAKHLFAESRSTTCRIGAVVQLPSVEL